MLAQNTDQKDAHKSLTNARRGANGYFARCRQSHEGKKAIKATPGGMRKQGRADMDTTEGFESFTKLGIKHENAAGPGEPKDGGWG